MTAHHLSSFHLAVTLSGAAALSVLSACAADPQASSAGLFEATYGSADDIGSGSGAWRPSWSCNCTTHGDCTNGICGFNGCDVEGGHDGECYPNDRFGGFRFGTAAERDEGARMVELAIGAYERALQNGGGAADAALWQDLAETSADAQRHADIVQFVHLTLSYAIGGDFAYPADVLSADPGQIVHVTPGSLALLRALREGLAGALRNDDPSLATTALLQFWDANPGYRPGTGGRCFTPALDARACQLDHVDRFLAIMLGS